VTYLLIGNYGAGNLGDEALKEYFLREFSGVRWQVISAHPESGELPRLPGGFRSLFTSWWRTIGAYGNADGIVFGGGTLFTDLESVSACLIWWWHALIARLFRKPLILAFQGVGPFRTGVGEWLARWVFRRATFISVRDEASRSRLDSWNLNKNIIQTFDPVVLLIRSENSSESSQNVFVIIPRNNSDAAFLARAMTLAKERAPQEIVILSLRPDNEEERAVCRRLVTALGGKARVVAVRSLQDLMREVARASFVLSQRYHGALMALALGKAMEVISQGAGDKLSELPSAVELPSCIDRAREGERQLRALLA